MPGKACVSNDRAAWLSRFILPHEPSLRAHLGRSPLPADLDVDDVIQEAYAKLATLDEVASIRFPRAYLFQIARSIILMHVRRSRVVSIQAVEQIETLGVASDEPGPETQTSDRQQLQLLAGMIAALPKMSRDAVTLRFVHDLSHGEIGRRLGKSPNAVQKCLAKSLSTFMRELGRGGSTLPEASTEEAEKDRPLRHAQPRGQLRD